MSHLTFHRLSLSSSSREEEEAVTRTYLENLLHPRGKSRATTGSPSTTLSRLQSPLLFLLAFEGEEKGKEERQSEE